MEIKGYKAFDKDGINRYGQEFLEDTHYHIDGKISFGNNGNGFHFCLRMEDTFRYFDSWSHDIDVAAVYGSGDIVEFNDEYYGYYDMYAASDLYVERFLSREEIIGHFLEANEFAVRRFVSSFRLTEEEIEVFKVTYADNINILNAISYYQEKDLDVYSRKSEQKIYLKKKIEGDLSGENRSV